jgi:putative transcription factor
MCGKKEISCVASVEGTELKVCVDCSRFGKLIKRVNPIQQTHNKITAKPQKQQEPEIIEKIVEGYGHIIRSSREKLNLNQEDFAKKINEKVSIVHSLESEHHKPSIDLAKKLEKLLKIKLVEQEKLEKIDFPNKTKGSLTIGDIIKIKNN